MKQAPQVNSAVEGIAWPAIPAPQAASMLAMQYQFEQSQWWPPQQLLAAQLTQARLLLQHAVKQVPYYRDQPQLSAVATDQPLTLENWQQLPLLERDSIQRAGKSLLSEARPKAHGRLLNYQTSGSTGQPLRGVDTEVTRFYWGAINLREQLWHRRDFSARFAAIRTKMKETNHKSWGGAVGTAFATGAAATLDISTPIAQQLQWLAKSRPTYLLSHPSNLRALALAAIETGQHCPTIRQLISFGEMLSPDVRQLCAEAWQGASLVDMYSSEELGYLALQCPDHQHYHVQAENLLVEVLDDDNQPCNPGQVGRVVATTLHNFGMPLIRYVNGDYAEVGPPCPCGRGLPVLNRILGRQRNMLTRPDGARYWPSFPAELWLDIAPFRQLRLVQKRLDWIEVQYVIDRDLNESQQRTLTSALQKQLDYPHEVTLARQAKISRTPNEKYEDFVNEIG